MWFPGMPTKDPTPAEYAVLVAFLATALIVMGGIALVVGFRLAPEQHELAVGLKHYGSWALGIGLALAGLLWLVRRLLS
jgi:hypothetical protein